MLPHWQQNEPYIASPGGNGWVKTKEESYALKQTEMIFLEASMIMNGEGEKERWIMMKPAEIWGSLRLWESFIKWPKIWAIRRLVIQNAALVIFGVLSQPPQNIVISGDQVWQVVGERITTVEQLIDGLYVSL